MNTKDETIEYLISCTLATVDDFCMRKTISFREYRRQVSIAQKGIDSFLELGCQVKEPIGRVGRVIENYNGSVVDYANYIREKWNPGMKKLKREDLYR